MDIGDAVGQPDGQLSGCLPTIIIAGKNIIYQYVKLYPHQCVDDSIISFYGILVLPACPKTALNRHTASNNKNGKRENRYAIT
ncbi:hypothetical protein XCR1_1490010 [Xenorhabdus cabanillasii JM26]|uniref:Uncharacterized protein n=1 Tax=Xenorhabdus cabanillasii JM26 TaxID=1427517 RepID=W1IRB9_9GAMM|nr:hypothetical protein XCR1_1490010 [Xenorhabdus cabanillasii JM26]